MIICLLNSPIVSSCFFPLSYQKKKRVKQLAQIFRRLLFVSRSEAKPIVHSLSKAKLMGTACSCSPDAVSPDKMLAPNIPQNDPNENSSAEVASNEAPQGQRHLSLSPAASGITPISMAGFRETKNNGARVGKGQGAAGLEPQTNTSIVSSNSRARSLSAFRAHRPASLPAADGGVYEVPDGTNPFLPTATSARAAQFESHPIVAAPILLRIDGLGPSDDVPTDHYDEHMRLRPLDPSQYVLFHIPHATYTTAESLGSQPNVHSAAMSFTALSMEATFSLRLEQMRSDLGISD